MHEVIDSDGISNDIRSPNELNLIVCIYTKSYYYWKVAFKKIIIEFKRKLNIIQYKSIRETMDNTKIRKTDYLTEYNIIH